ncbi:MAG: hypothetical protein GMKNLPBB_01111 [Myxococcota bacterium]|nr:hypothetical protein [Myxococcota bacterium]
MTTSSAFFRALFLAEAVFLVFAVAACAGKAPAGPGMPAGSRAALPPLTAPAPAFTYVHPVNEEAGPFAAQINRRLRLRIRAHKYLIPVLVAQNEDPALEEKFRRAQELLKAGKGHWIQLDPEQGIAEMREARKLFEETLFLGEDNAAYLESLIFLGAFETLFGDRKKALEAFGALLDADPKARMNPATFPPQVRETFEMAARRRMEEATGGLQLISRPPYAEIYVDGAFAGFAPYSSTSIRAGRHRVRAFLPGFGQWDETIDVEPLQTVRPVLTITPHPRRTRAADVLEPLERGSAKSDQRKDFLALLADRLEVQRVLFGLVEQQELGIRITLEAFDAPSGVYCQTGADYEISGSSWMEAIENGAVTILENPAAGCGT